MRENGMYRMAALVLDAAKKDGGHEFDRADLQTKVIARAESDGVRRKDMAYSYSVAVTLLCDGGYLQGKNSKPNGRHRGPYRLTPKARAVNPKGDLSGFYDEIRRVHVARKKRRPMRPPANAKQLGDAANHDPSDSLRHQVELITGELASLKSDVALMKAAITKLLG
jgi:hypothetical protein